VPLRCSEIMPDLKWLLAGTVLGLAVCLALSLLEPRRAVELLALVLAATASVYIGAALAEGRSDHLVMEVAIFIPVLLAAVAGLWHSTPWLAFGFLLHGAWDFFHHPRPVGAQVGPNFPPLCITFDAVVGVFVLAWL
jgi:hypothetical protein